MPEAALPLVSISAPRRRRAHPRALRRPAFRGFSPRRQHPCAAAVLADPFNVCAARRTCSTSRLLNQAIATAGHQVVSSAHCHVVLRVDVPAAALVNADGFLAVSLVVIGLHLQRFAARPRVRPSAEDVCDMRRGDIARAELTGGNSRRIEVEPERTLLAVRRGALQHQRIRPLRPVGADTARDAVPAIARRHRTGLGNAVSVAGSLCERAVVKTAECARVPHCSARRIKSAAPDLDEAAGR